MTNEMIGIAGVLALAFVLLVLRHCFVSIGRAKKGRYVNPTASRGHYELNKKAVEDDSWLLWSPDTEAGSRDRADETTRVPRERRDKRKSALRFIKGR